MIDEKMIEEIKGTLTGAADLCYESEDVGNFYKAIEILDNIKKLDEEQEKFIVKDTYTKGKFAGLRRAKLLLLDN